MSAQRLHPSPCPWRNSNLHGDGWPCHPLTRNLVGLIYGSAESFTRVPPALLSRQFKATYIGSKRSGKMQEKFEQETPPTSSNPFRSVRWTVYITTCTMILPQQKRGISLESSSLSPSRLASILPHAKFALEGDLPASLVVRHSTQLNRSFTTECSPSVQPDNPADAL